MVCRSFSIFLKEEPCLHTKLLKKLCRERGIAVTALEKELGFGRRSIGKLRNSQTSAERLQKIADYFNVTVDYLVNGTDNNGLTARDNRDIAKDLDNIMEKLTSGENGPASYNGEEIRSLKWRNYSKMN